MSEVPKVKEYLHVVKDESRRKLRASILKAFDDEVIPVIGTLVRETHFLVLHKLTQSLVLQRLSLVTISVF